MLGNYDYTVWLTYLSAVLGVTGTLFGMAGEGHPWTAGVCLILCAILDGFDGRVARSKKNRTEQEKRYGIEIDSFADTISFGVLPCALVYALGKALAPQLPQPCWAVYFVVAPLFVLAAVIRLASFNVEAEAAPQKPHTGRKAFTGLPVTSSGFIYPQLLLIQFFLRDSFNLLPVCLAVMALQGFLFLFKPLRISKMGLGPILVLAALGGVEIIALLVLFLNSYGG